MNEYATYCGKTAALGLLAGPALVSTGYLLSILATDAVPLPPLDWSVGAWLLPVIVIVVTQFPLWFWWGRRSKQVPDTWLRGLLPVAAVPALLLLGWSVSYLVLGSDQAAMLDSVWAAFPYLVLMVFSALAGEYWVVPVSLAAVLLVSVAAYLGGRARREPPATGLKGLAGVLAAILVITAVPAVQVGQALWLQQVPTIGDEVDLWQYRPWEPDNRLVVPNRAPSLRLTDDFPRLDGATAFYPVYAASGQAVYVRPPGYDEAKEDVGFTDFYLACNRTAEAYNRLIAGEADLIFALEPSQGHRARAAAAGVDLRLTPIGREAFTFFVNEGNPVTGLTSDQLRDIYAGRITTWSQLGGADEPITAYQRPEDSGSQTIMLAEVMRDAPMMPPLKDTVVGGMGGVINEVADYKNLSSAIGYTFRWYATVMNGNPGIRLLAVDGVEPTVENIRNGSYPFIVDIYAVTAGTTNPNTQRLVDWVVSEEGQALVDQVGYVGR